MSDPKEYPKASRDATVEHKNYSEAPVFQPPPAEPAGAAFLRGDFGNVYRASGGGVDVYARPDLSPAPLQFPSDVDYGVAQQWHGLLDQPANTRTAYNKQKSLHTDLGHRQPVGAPTLSSSSSASVEEDMAQLALSSAATPGPAHELDLDHTDDEAEPLAAAGPGPHSILLSCSVDESELLREVAGVFERSIDYEMDFNIGRIRGVAHDKCERCQFAVQRHASGADRSTLVFSRRSGSASLFSSIIATTRAGLAKTSFCSDVALGASTMAPKAFDALGLSGGEVAMWAPSGEDEEMALDEASCHALVAMCCSEFTDVRQEALSTLGALMGSARACREIQAACGSELVAALATAGQADHDELQWLCGYVAAHMCTVPEFASQSLALVPTLFALLTSSATLSRRGAKRLAARALELITRCEGQAVLRQTAADGQRQYLGVLEHLFHSPDQVLRASIRLIVQQLTKE